MVLLREQYEAHLVAAREGREEPYSFQPGPGIDYNSYLEHRHGWPITADGLCGPSLSSRCCDEHDDSPRIPAEECSTCTGLKGLYEKLASSGT
ncbi:hypothetical protein ACFXKF_32950 [Streptomyces scopuliridis]|uniref:hypothetical protein n=1 Tax=Streptomyces scopuliridis TaxID=452529 RepID=UPI0036BD0B4D